MNLLFCVQSVASQKIWSYIPKSQINDTTHASTHALSTAMYARGEVPAPSPRMVTEDTCVPPAIAALLALLRRGLARPGATVPLPGGSTASPAPTGQPALLWLPGNPLSAPQVRVRVSEPRCQSPGVRDQVSRTGCQRPGVKASSGGRVVVCQPEGCWFDPRAPPS